MITGTVNARYEAILPLTIYDQTRQPPDFRAAVDTGFNGSLTLPSSLIESLGLPWRTQGSAVLADGSLHRFDIHAAVVLWDGNTRIILVEAAETEPLVGMALLIGYGLHIEV